MAAFLPEASIVNAIVALVVVEGILLVAWRARTGGGLPIGGILANLSSGAALLLSLRTALTAGSSVTVLAWLSIALVAHLVDLAGRWQAASRPLTARRQRVSSSLARPPESQPV